MKATQLAMVNVPCQQWGPLYADEKALCQGTIFQELDLPFYVTDGISAEQSTPGGNQAKTSTGGSGKAADVTGESRLLCQLQQVSFALDDLTLYLDIHSEDGQALSLYQKKMTERDQLKREFARKFYPLTKDCVAFCRDDNGIHGDHGFCWQDGPMPWEGV